MKQIVFFLLIFSFSFIGIAQNISSLSSSEIETKMRTATDGGNYDKAAQWKEVGELKKELDQALQNSDYAKASKLKKEMDEHPVSDNTAAPPPPAQQKTEPAISTTSSNYDPSSSNNKSGASQRGMVLYQFGSYTPIGIVIGVLTSQKVGFYYGVRLSPSVFNEKHSYEMGGGVINEYDSRWNYTGGSEYRRWSATFGLTGRLAGNLNGFGLHVYFGLGYGQALYLYEYARVSKDGFVGSDQWILDTDLSIKGVEIEGGLIFDIYGFAMTVGYTSINFQEYMFTMGLGFSFKGQ